MPTIVRPRRYRPPDQPAKRAARYTREHHDKLRLCGAKLHKRTDGSTCRRPAGWGTDHVGLGQCKLHGGATPNGRRSALVQDVKLRMISRAVPIEDASPHVVLMQELQWTTGHINVLLEEIQEAWQSGEITDLTRLALDRFDAERDRRGRIAENCARVGLDEAITRIQEAHAVLLFKAVVNAAREIGIHPETVKALGPALRRELAWLEGDEAAYQAAEPRVIELRERIKARDQQRIEREAQKYVGLVPADEFLPTIEGTASDTPATA